MENDFKMPRAEDIIKRSEEFQAEAEAVLEEAGIATVWRDAGCRVEIVGSMRMRLMANHRDIDLHVYSPVVTEADSFAIAAKIAKNPKVKEIKCINGLMTDEHCIAWHFIYEGYNGKLWQFDVIHIVEGSRYDGYFEEMADRIIAHSTPEQRETILRLKLESTDYQEGTPPEDSIQGPIHGVEYYEGVINHDITTLDQLRQWVISRRKQPFHYWMPGG